MTGVLLTWRLIAPTLILELRSQLKAQGPEGVAALAAEALAKDVAPSDRAQLRAALEALLTRWPA